MPFVILLYALFASVFTIAKMALEYTQPLFLVGSRMLVAGMIMLGYLYLFKRDELVYKKGSFWRLARLAVFNIYLTNAFEFWGLKYLTSFKTCFIYSLSPFLSAIFSYFILHEKLTPKKFAGLAIGFIGFFPMLLVDGAGEEDLNHFFFLSWAEIAVMCAATSAVYGWIVLRQLVKDDGYSSMTVNGFSMIGGGAMALIHSALVEPWDPVPVTEFMPFFQLGLALIVVSNLLCYNMYGWLLRRFTATFMSFAGFTTPFFTALFGWLLLSEQPSSMFFLSCGAVAVGLLFFYQEELKGGVKVASSPKVVNS